MAHAGDRQHDPSTGGQNPSPRSVMEDAVRGMQTRLERACRPHNAFPITHTPTPTPPNISPCINPFPSYVGAGERPGYRLAGYHERFTIPPSAMCDSKRSSTPIARLVLFVLAAVGLASCGGPNLVERITSPRWGFCGTLVIVLDIVALVDLLGDDGRTTANKVLWSLAILFMPILGVVLYFAFGR